MRNLVFLLLVSLGSLSLFGDDLSQLVAKANAGDAAAQYQLGTMYNTGNGVQRDPDQAFNWFQNAARQGHVGAMYRLAIANYNGGTLGDSVKENLGLSWAWFKLAAAAGDSAAQNDAARMWNELSERERQSAPALLGDMVATLATSTDVSRWMRPESDAGQMLTRMRDAKTHLSSERHDEQTASLECATAFGSKPAAALCMGLLYEMQPDPDPRRATEWYRKAADQLEPHAMFHMGAMYAGHASPKEALLEGYFWFSLANRYGDKRASTAMTQIAATADPKTISKAEAKAQHFADNHTPRSLPRLQH